MGPAQTGTTTTPSATPSLDPSSVAGLQGALAGEHAAVWAYGVLGPRLDEAGRARVRSLLDTHEKAREAIRARVVGSGAAPVLAEPAYALPVTPTDPGTAAGLAMIVEERLVAVYAELVAATASAELRAVAVDAMRDGALRALSWGPIGTVFPGLPERSGG